MAKHTPARQLFDLLVSRDFDPEMLDVAGKPASNPAKAELFNFDFRAESGKDYGTVVVLLGDENNLEVYFGDNVGRTMEGDDKSDWFEFLKQLKHFAVKNFMEFSPKNINRLRYSMQTQAAIKESLFESWRGTRTVSWNGAQTEARLMIRHKKTLDETDARYRYIESLFVETADGERYKLPFTKLSGGRAMVEHVRQGGKPYDIRGQHIATMVEEINVLSRFRRANQGRLLEGDTLQLATDANRYYENLHRNLKGLSSRTGYQKYFESWNPAEITDEEVVVEGLKHLFVTQSIDNRIESALPLLARIQQQGKAMKEATIFEAWAQSLMEGTWQLPDTPEKQDKLIKLMQQDLPVGADATNATEQLYELIGDDELFDQLEALAERDANADCRQVIYDRMSELSDHPEVLKVIEQLQIDPEAEMNPPEGTPADLEPQEPVQEGDLENVKSIGGDAADALIKDTEVPQRNLSESRMLDEDGSKLDHILDRFKYEVRHFEQGGDLDQHLYDALYDYYVDAGEIPYGVQKARDGDPYEWVAQNLESHLSGGGIVGGNPDEDYGIERESVMHGDYAEEATDPMTQTEDPYNTAEPAYPEYADPLSKILKIAGVPAGERATPVYNHSEMEEGAIGSILGGLAGGALAGPTGAKIGSVLGSKIGDEMSSDNTNETIDPANPRDYEIPAVQRRAQGQAPLSMKDIEQKDRKAEFDFYQRAHGEPHPDQALARIKELSGNKAVGSHNGKPTVEYRGIFYVKQPNGSWASLKGDHVAEPAVKQVLDKMHQQSTLDEVYIDPTSKLGTDATGAYIDLDKSAKQALDARATAAALSTGPDSDKMNIQPWMAGIKSVGYQGGKTPGDKLSGADPETGKPLPPTTNGSSSTSSIKQMPSKDMGDADVIDVEEDQSSDSNARFQQGLTGTALGTAGGAALGSLVGAPGLGAAAGAALGGAAGVSSANKDIEASNQASIDAATAKNTKMVPLQPYDTEKVGSPGGPNFVPVDIKKYPQLDPEFKKSQDAYDKGYSEDASPLAGQYGHSGKMKPVDKDLSFLDRLKELSGMKK